MSLTIKNPSKAEDAADFIANSISNQLKSAISVLFFVSGGSAISVAVKVADLLRGHDCKNLTVMLTDERYGAPGHADSNWQQLMDKGFNLPQANLVPTLTGDDFETTTEKFNENLAYEFNVAGYTIGLFGIGTDGHTAGILPDSPAVKSKDLACGYKTPTFSRITTTPSLIEQMSEVVLFAQGEEKWPVIKDLEKNIDIMKAPVQVLKKVPLLTIFTGFKK